MGSSSASSIVNASAVPLPQTPAGEAPPPLARSHTSSSGFFGNLHIPKPLRPLTSFSRNGSSSSLAALNNSHYHAGSSAGTEHHPSASALSSALAAHAAKSSSHRHGGPTLPLEIHTHSAMSNSPSPIGINAANGGGSGSGGLGSGGTSPVVGSPSSGFNHHHPHHHHHHTGAASPLQHQTSYLNSSSRSGPPSPVHTPSFGRTVHDMEDEGHGSHVPYEPPTLSTVPPYEVAARGFLGGGVTPISRGLPNYEDN
jgi:hypothetical protein